MSVEVNWRNPYEDRRGGWLKGNLHAHTSPASGCGKVAIQRVWDLYVQAGYDFLSLSDHMNFSAGPDSRMVWVPGIEWNSASGEHTGVHSTDHQVVQAAIGIANHDELLKYLCDKDALVILNHPNWQLVPHYRREQLEAKGPYHAIEVYNHVIERLAGYAISSDKWDYLLHKGRRVLGLASDDSHTESDINGAALYVRCADRSAGAILDAIRRGNFYAASGGMTIADIRREGDEITIDAPGAQEIRAIGCGGVSFVRQRTQKLTFAFTKDYGSYIRFEAYGQGSSIVWTQPFFQD